MIKLFRKLRGKSTRLLIGASTLAVAVLVGVPTPAFADNWQPQYSGRLVSQNSLPGQQMCLSTTYGTGSTVYQWACTGGWWAQQWSIVPVGDGYYSKIVSWQGNCLDVYAYNHDNYGLVTTWNCIDGASNQEWHIGWTAHGFILQPRHAIFDNWGQGKCLDVYAFSHDNDGRVVQWDCLGGVNQLWGPVAGL
jgi:hypothetical protein